MTCASTDFPRMYAVDNRTGRLVKAYTLKEKSIILVTARCRIYSV